MISVTKLNHTEILLNSDLIEHVEETPDTVILLTNGHVLQVRDTKEQVLQKVIDFRRAIAARPNSNVHPISLKQGSQFHGQFSQDHEA